MLALAMKPNNPVFSAACERLAERALSMERGTLLTFDELERLTALPRNILYQAVIRVNRDLLKAKRLLVNVRRQGYLLSDVGDQMRHAHGRKLKAARQHAKGFKELASVEVGRLTKDQRKIYEQQLATMGMLMALSRKHTLAGIQHSMKAVQHQEAALAVQNDLQRQMKALQRLLTQAIKQR